MTTAHITYSFAGAVGSFAMAMDGCTLVEGADAAGVELLAAGFVRACQSVPMSEDIELEFDEA